MKKQLSAVIAEELDKIRRSVSRIFRFRNFLTEIGVPRLHFRRDETAISSDTPTMATDGTTVFYHPLVLERWPEAHVQGTIVHEWFHGGLLHSERYARLPVRNRALFNKAADMVINEMVLALGFQLPPFAIKMPPEFSGWSVEAIYRELLRRRAKQPKPPGKPKPQPPGDEGDSSEEPGDDEGDDKDGGISDDEDESADEKDGDGKGKGKGEEQEQEEKPDPGSGDLREPPKDKPQTSATEQEAQAKATLMRIAEAAKQAGCLPAGLEILLKEWLKPKVDWREQLRYLSTTPSRNASSYVRTHNSYRAMGYYVPGQYSRELEPFVIVRDTSGSLYGMQDKVTAEAKGAVDELNPSKTYILDVDTEVHRVLEIGPLDDWPGDVLGGGGTDFRPAFDKVAELKIQPSVLVYITDTYGTFPDKAPDYPVVWALIDTSPDAKVPFGETVYVPKED